MPRGFAAARSMPPASRDAALRRPSDHGVRDVDVVSALAQLVDDSGREARLELDVPRLRLARIERAREVVRVEHRQRRSPPAGSARRARGGGRDERPLVLLVAARRAEREIRLAVAQRERRARASCAGACRGSSEFGRPSSSQNICARVPSGKAEPGHDGRALQPAAARRGRDEVARSGRRRRDGTCRPRRRLADPSSK